MLDPHISYEGLVADYKQEPELLADIKAAKANFEQHFLENFQPSVSTSISATTISTQTSAAWIDVDDSPVKIDFLARYAQQKSAPASLQGKLEEYFCITTSRAKIETDPLEWWHARCEQFPSLYHFAHDILCIPGESQALHVLTILVLTNVS